MLLYRSEGDNGTPESKTEHTFLVFCRRSLPLFDKPSSIRYSIPRFTMYRLSRHKPRLRRTA